MRRSDPWTHPKLYVLTEREVGLVLLIGFNVGLLIGLVIGLWG